MISEYWSIKEAVRQTGINQSLISLCCNRKRLTAGGFVLRYQDDPKAFSEEDTEERKRLREKAVNQYDLNDRYLKTFKSISEAKRKTGVSAVPRAVLGDLLHCKAVGFSGDMTLEITAIFQRQQRDDRLSRSTREQIRLLPPTNLPLKQRDRQVSTKLESAYAAEEKAARQASISGSFRGTLPHRLRKMKSD